MAIGYLEAVDKSHPILVATALVLSTFGACFVLIPTLLFPLYGVTLDPAGLMLARVAGAAVLGLGMLAWLTRRAALEARRPAHRALALFFLVKAIVTVLALLAGVLNTWGWTILAIDIPLFAMNAGESLGEDRPRQPVA